MQLSSYNSLFQLIPGVKCDSKSEEQLSLIFHATILELVKPTPAFLEVKLHKTPHPESVSEAHPSSLVSKKPVFWLNAHLACKYTYWVRVLEFKWSQRLKSPTLTDLTIHKQWRRPTYRFHRVRCVLGVWGWELGEAYCGCKQGLESRSAGWVSEMDFSFLTRKDLHGNLLCAAWLLYSEAANYESISNHLIYSSWEKDIRHAGRQLFPENWCFTNWY